MLPKFQSTSVRENAPYGEKSEARSLRLAFAVVGKMIAEDWIQVDFNRDDWNDELRNKVVCVAEVLNDFQ